MGSAQLALFVSSVLLVQVDQMWLDRLACAWQQQKGSFQGMIKHLWDCWKEVVNPHSTTLFILENLNVFEGDCLLYLEFSGFNHWVCDCILSCACVE
jgi:hypothetical protein